MREITREWLEAANLDLETIPYIIGDDRLTGHVAFHSQQAIEKSLKAVIEDFGQKVPKIHTLQKLFDICSATISINYDENLIIALDSLYLESRYPGEFGLLPNGKPDIKQVETYYEFAQNIYHTLKQFLENKL